MQNEMDKEKRKKEKTKKKDSHECEFAEQNCRIGEMHAY